MPERITDARDLKVGDVVTVAQHIQGKFGENDYWWKSFRVVVDPPMRRSVMLMILKMRPDPAKDWRLVDVSDDRFVITKLDESAWPQGVSAMYMKHLATGLIKLGD